MGWPCPAIPNSGLRPPSAVLLRRTGIPHSLQGVFGRLCPRVRRWELDVGCWMFGVPNKLSEYNLPLPPRSGWSGGTLDKPWTHPGTIDPLPDPVFDQARLSMSFPCRSATGSRCPGLDVAGWMFDVGCFGPFDFLRWPPPSGSLARCVNFTHSPRVR